ncbi:5509_t:CDS:2 [Entrophospora sp. SA101]|nr:8586_t:CDS:2 [Entrophospora sp. SA101]CAJ0901797.1 5509_t:CDS:2 [Entrophospora sp. SA101]
MPEPILSTFKNFIPSAEQFGSIGATTTSTVNNTINNTTPISTMLTSTTSIITTPITSISSKTSAATSFTTTSFTNSIPFSQDENKTFVEHLQILVKIEPPNTIIYHALSTDLPIPNLLEIFQTSAQKIDHWLEYANVTILALDFDIKEGVNIRNVSEMDVLIHKYAPNIDLLQELFQLTLSKLNSGDDQNYKDIKVTFDRINSDWLEVKSFFAKVKKEISESKQRREFLDKMDQILASIEELDISIFEYQEQRHSDNNQNSNESSFPFPRLSSSPTLRNNRPITPGAPTGIINNGSGNNIDFDAALIKLDSKLEPLSARIEYLKSRLTGSNAPSDPNGILRKKYNLLNDKWESLKNEMDSLREELKEDKWVGVFKQVGGNANQMMDSLERSVKQCKDFMYRAANGPDSTLPSKYLKNSSSRGINYQRLYKNFDAKSKYYVPAVTKLLTMLGNNINNQMTRDWDSINKYNAMKERWDSILDGVNDVHRDMPALEYALDASLIPSNSPPSSIPSSVASSPPISPNVGPTNRRPVSPYRRVVSPTEYGYSSSPPRNNNNLMSSSTRSKSPSPPNGRRSKSSSRSGSPIRPTSTRPISPDRVNPSAIPRPVTSMGIGYRSQSRAGARSFLPKPSTPQPGMTPTMSRLEMISPTLPPINSFPSSRRNNPVRSPTPSSVTSSTSRPITPEIYDDNNNGSGNRPITPTDTLLQRSMSSSETRSKYVPLKNDPLDIEVAKVVNSSPLAVKVERVSTGTGKYYFGNESVGRDRKVHLCKLMNFASGRNKVMVRVGGGWQDLDMFLLDHSLMNVRI